MNRKFSLTNWIEWPNLNIAHNGLCDENPFCSGTLRICLLGVIPRCWVVFQKSQFNEVPCLFVRVIHDHAIVISDWFVVRTTVSDSAENLLWAWIIEHDNTPFIAELMDVQCTDPLSYTNKTRNEHRAAIKTYAFVLERLIIVVSRFSNFQKKKKIITGQTISKSCDRMYLAWYEYECHTQ